MAVPVKLKMDRATTTNIILLVAGIVLIIVVIVIVFKFRKSIAEKIETQKVSKKVKDNQKETEEIQEETGLTETEIDRARNIANFIADKMGTHKDTPFYEPALFGAPKNAIIDYLNRIESEEEAVLVASFYEDKMTDNRVLRADLDALFTNIGLSKIEFNYAIN